MLGLFSFAHFGVPSPFDPAFHYVTSPVLSPLVLGVLRLTFAVYALVTVAASIPIDADPGAFFSYFTNLTFIGLVAYFFAAGVQTVAFAFRGRKRYPLQRWPRFFQLLHVLLHTTVVVFPFIVTIVYWTLLVSPFDSAAVAWSSISKHAINAVLALFEILLTHGGPAPWTHLIPLIVILACYLGLAYLTHATQGFYTYAFLDPVHGRGMVAAYVVGILLGCCVVFGVVKGVCTLRRWICVRSGRYVNPEGLGEWQDVEAPKAAQ